MSQMQLSECNIAFFVEGMLEREFLSNVCPQAHIFKLPNGKDVELSLIVDRIIAYWSPYRGALRYGVIVLDRERRQQSAQNVVQSITDGLVDHGIPETDFCVGCPDIMIENWILADHNRVSEKTGVQFPAYAGDGSPAKTELDAALKGIGIKYHGPTTGARLLKSARPSIIAQNSASATSFFESLNIDCWWLDRD